MVSVTAVLVMIFTPEVGGLVCTMCRPSRSPTHCGASLRLRCGCSRLYHACAPHERFLQPCATQRCACV
eukprot:6203209-Pleurochrysis_carterae.AAC.2